MHAAGGFRPCLMKIWITQSKKRMNKNKTESDPNGFDQHNPGAKLDAGKLRAGLVLNGFSVALQEVCKIGTYGANKYTDNGWRSVPDGQKRYHDAMYRHLLEHAKNEIDEESGFTHLAHAAWNILALLELKTAEKNSTAVQAAENFRREFVCVTSPDAP